MAFPPEKPAIPPKPKQSLAESIASTVEEPVVEEAAEMDPMATVGEDLLAAFDAKDPQGIVSALQAFMDLRGE